MVGMIPPPGDVVALIARVMLSPHSSAFMRRHMRIWMQSRESLYQWSLRRAWLDDQLTKV